MSKLRFCYFMDYEDGKIARLETENEKIPVNVFIDNADDFSDATKGSVLIDLCGVGSEIDIYSSEEEYNAAEQKTAVHSLIPMGTFPVESNKDDFKESPHILFTGTVSEVQWNPEAGEDDANCCLTIDTLDLSFNLYIRTDHPVEKGFVVSGVVLLFGDIVSFESDDE